MKPYIGVYIKKTYSIGINLVLPVRLDSLHNDTNPFQPISSVYTRNTKGKGGCEPWTNCNGYSVYNKALNIESDVHCNGFEQIPGFSGNDRACANSRYQAVFLLPSTRFMYTCGIITLLDEFFMAESISQVYGSVHSLLHSNPQKTSENQ